jgi:hypothetical protein
VQHFEHVVQHFERVVQVLRPKPGSNEEFNAHFFTLVSQGAQRVFVRQCVQRVFVRQCVQRVFVRQCVCMRPTRLPPRSGPPAMLARACAGRRSRLLLAACVPVGGLCRVRA